MKLKRSTRHRTPDVFTFLPNDIKLITVILSGRSEIRNARREGISMLCCSHAHNPTETPNIHSLFTLFTAQTSASTSVCTEVSATTASTCRVLFGRKGNPLQARNLTLSRNTSRLSLNPNSSKHQRRCLRKTCCRLMLFLQILSFQLSPTLLSLKSQN